MLRFFLKKVSILLITLLLIMSTTFVLMKSIPGDPFMQEKELPPEILSALYAHYGLDKPLYIQYFKYLKEVVTFNLGPSLVYQGRTVGDIISCGLPISAALGLEALAIAFFTGILLGCAAAAKEGKWPEYGVIGISIIGSSIPGFLLATILQYIFAIKLGWLPVARWESFWHSILPALSLSAMPMAFIAKLTRASMQEVLSQNYINAALIKGLSMRKVIMKHALRNALLPVVAYLGPVGAYILTGSFVIEKIFGIPGLGQWMVLSISNRDYSLILGLCLFISLVLVITVFAVDLICKLIDPRIKITGKRNEVGFI